MLDWLFASIDATRPHNVDVLTSWHGRFMTLAWVVCAPAGIVIARYFKVMPNQNWPEVLDNKRWWTLHLVLQITTAVAVALGLVLILLQTGGDAHLHRLLGWIVAAGLAAQLLSGIFRGTKGGPTDPGPDGSLDGDHYLMTRHRLIFEAFHKGMGYSLLALAAVTVFMGMWLANGPRWMFLVVLLYWLALSVITLVLARRTPRVTTYQAIWGPDKSLPGNKKTKGFEHPPD